MSEKHHSDDLLGYAFNDESETAKPQSSDAPEDNPTEDELIERLRENHGCESNSVEVIGGYYVGPTDPPLTDLQALIWKALEGKALMQEALANVVSGGDTRVFYRPGGLTEMRERKLVEHKHGLGYYRLDSPPETLP